MKTEQGFFTKDKDGNIYKNGKIQPMRYCHNPITADQQKMIDDVTEWVAERNKNLNQ